MVLDTSGLNWPTKIDKKIRNQPRHQRKYIYTGCTLKLRAVKLLFVIFGRLSYTFFRKKICNLSVQPVYTMVPKIKNLLTITIRAGLKKLRTNGNTQNQYAWSYSLLATGPARIVGGVG